VILHECLGYGGRLCIYDDDSEARNNETSIYKLCDFTRCESLKFLYVNSAQETCQNVSNVVDYC
jgi:hypothetical protein